ncbi:hypothetical protein UB34_19950, partial [Photobacterium leiognathi]
MRIKKTINNLVTYVFSLLIITFTTNIKAEEHISSLEENTIYLFDSAVKDIDHLSKTITQPIYTINPTQSVLLQFADIAKAHPNAKDWHIISHGQSGELQLGSERWNKPWLEQTDVSNLLDIMPKNSHWHLYACDLAKGEVGKAFVDDLARAMKVSISASTNKTGVIAGADTLLEYPLASNHKSRAHQLNFQGYRYSLSLQALQDWANNLTTTEPQLITYHNADPLFSALETRHVPFLNSVLQKGTLTTVPDIADAITAIIKIESYTFNADSATLPVEAIPNRADYDSLGLTSTDFLLNENLTYFNALLGSSSKALNNFTHYIKSSEVDYSAGFGRSVDISDDGMTIAVWAENASAGTYARGAVYIYRREGDSWEEVKILRIDTNDFTQSMSMSGNGTRVVLTNEAGSYVFIAPKVDGETNWRGNWERKGTISMTRFDEQRVNLSADGSTVVVGGDYRDRYNPRNTEYTYRFNELDNKFDQYDITRRTTFLDGSEPNSQDISADGTVYVIGDWERDLVYIYSDNGVEFISQQIEKADGFEFGHGVAINDMGDRIAVVEFLRNAIYIYDRNDADNSWQQTQILQLTEKIDPTISSTERPSRVEMSPDGNKIAVVSLKPSVHVYDISNSDSTTWQETEETILLDHRPNSFGGLGLTDISFNGSQIVVGARLDDSGYSGVLTDSDDNDVFDDNDVSSTNSTISGSTNEINSGAVYVVEYQPTFALDTIEELQARNDAIKILIEWATEVPGAQRPEALHYSVAGITDVIGTDDGTNFTGNLNDINTQLRVLKLDDMTLVQPLVNDINAILSFTADAAFLPQPDDDLYNAVGLDAEPDTPELDAIDVTIADFLNIEAGGSGMTVVEIQAFIRKTNNLNILFDYSADQGNGSSGVIVPEWINYDGATIINVEPLRVADYNLGLELQTYTTEEQIQDMVDAINALLDFASGDSSIPPSFTDYQNAGFTDFRKDNVAIANVALTKLETISLASVQDYISSVTKLVKYALGEAPDSPPLKSDYDKVGVLSVGENIVDYLNGHLSKEVINRFNAFFKTDIYGGYELGDRVEISDDGHTVAAFTDNGRFYVYRLIDEVWQPVYKNEDSFYQWFRSDFSMSADGRRIVAVNRYNVYTYDVNLQEGEPNWRSWSEATRHQYQGSDSALVNVELSADGKTLLVGNLHHKKNGSGIQEGMVKVFQEENGTWTERGHWTGQNNYDHFGAVDSFDVSEDGRVIAIGFYKQGQSRGYVDILNRNANGTSWSLSSNDIAHDDLSASNGENDDQFGITLSLSRNGTRLAVSAPQEDGEPTDEVDDRGAVYIFDYQAGTGWAQTEILRHREANVDDKFGSRLELSPDGFSLVVSTAVEDAVYLYDLSSNDTSLWQHSETVVSSISNEKEAFGRSLAINGNEILVGAPGNQADYQGVVTNTSGNTVSDGSPIFGVGDTSSEGQTSTDFVNTNWYTQNNGNGYENGAVYALVQGVLITLEYLQARIDGSNAILAWAAGGEDAPSPQQYDDAEVIGVSDLNLNDINTQLQTLAHSDMADVQPMVHAINALLDHSNSTTPAGSPSRDDYRLAGVPVWLPLADMNNLIENQNYSIQDILALIPLPAPILSVDKPLHIDDPVAWLNQAKTDQLFIDYQTINPATTLNVVWQVRESASSSWVDIGLSGAYYELQGSHTEGDEYRLKLLVDSTDASDVSFSLTSDSTGPATALIDDINMSYDASLPPQIDVAYRLLSHLEPVSTPFKRKVHTWYRVLENGSLETIADDQDQYTPIALDEDLTLIIRITYFDDADNLILARNILTPAVIAAPSSADLKALAEKLELTLTPDGISVGTSVSLTSADQTEINNVSNVTPSYRWEHLSLSGVALERQESYVARNMDVGQRIRLVLTLTDSGTNETLTLHSLPSSVVQANAAGLDTFPLLLQFDRNTQRLSLTDASTERVTEYATEHGLINPAYEWLRIAEQGGFDDGAQQVGSSALGYILTANDETYRHALRLSFDSLSNESVTLFSAITRPWDDGSADRDLQTELERLRYMDVLTLNGGSDPAIVGNILQASLLGSVEEKDMLPQTIDYQWYQSTSGELSNETTSIYTVAGNDGGETLHATATFTDTLGEVSPALTSPSRAVSTAAITDGWEVSISPYVDTLLVGQVLTADHRIVDTANGESVSYTWYRLDNPSDWSTAKEIITAADQRSYTITIDDLDKHFGLKATLSTASFGNFDATDVTPSAVLAPSGNAYSLTATILPLDIYNNSQLSYDYAITINGATVSVPASRFSAEWFAAPSKRELQAKASTRQSIDPLDLTNIDGQHIELLLTYTSGSDVVAASFYSSTVVSAADTPTLFDSWYSVITMSDTPAILTSSTDLIDADSTETDAPNSSYNVTYRFFSDQAPKTEYTDLTLLAQDLPSTGSVRVEALQTSTANSSVTRTLVKSFDFRASEVYRIRTLAKPRLEFEKPLHPNDIMGLQNQVAVEQGVAALRASAPSVNVVYQWQSKTGDNGMWLSVGWVGVGTNLTTYRDLLSLTENTQYRLAIIASDQTYSDTLYSDVSVRVQSSSQPDYDIIFDDVAIPRVLTPMNVSTMLHRNGQGAVYGVRQVRWEVLNEQGVIVQSTEGETYTPASAHEGLKVRVSVTYFDENDVVLVEASHLSEAIAPAFTSQPIEQLALNLSLKLVPDGVSVGTTVGFNDTDMA